MNNTFNPTLMMFILLLAGTSIYAQQARTTDMEVVLAAPDSGTVIYNGDAITASIKIINNGPDALMVGDTLFFNCQYSSTEGVSDQTPIFEGVLTQPLPPSQTPFVINANIPFSTPYPELHMNFCVHVLNPNSEPVLDENNNPIQVSYNDPDTTNNTSCTSIIIETKETDIATVKPTLTQLQLFPNPARGLVNIKLPDTWSGPLNVFVNDITGRKILVQHYITKPETKQLLLDVSSLTKGIYLITLQTGTRKVTGKLIIAK